MRALVVSGSRDLAGPIDSAFVRQALWDLSRRLWGAQPPALVIHGACGIQAGEPIALERMRGADLYAHVWAADMEAQPVPMPADWAAHGTAAGPRRNRALVEVADCLMLSGWDVHAAVFPLDDNPRRGSNGFAREWRNVPRLSDRITVFRRDG